MLDNRNFWNKRYATDPELGSGIGSRGNIRTYKRELLQRTIEMLQPRSILDIGCGDMTVGDVLPGEIYLGVDISDEVVARNSAQYPTRRFVHGNLLELDLQPVDLTICMDVSIHLSSVEEYQCFIKRIVELTRGEGIISGYETPPPVPSEITYFHEPLSDTLRKVGGCNIRRIGMYRQVTVFSFNRDSGQDVQPMDSYEEELHRPIFVVGAMRSGTTLLAEMLGSSPDVRHCSFELKDVWSQEGGFPMASAKTKDETCPELGADDATPQARRRLVAAFTQRMNACAGKKDDAVLLNKNPHLCNKLNYVNALFPDARFIWIYRHLPQVVASLKRLFEDVQRRQNTWHWWPEPSPNTHNRCWNAFHRSDDRATVTADRVFPGGSIRYLAEYWLESNRAVSEFFAEHASGNCYAVAQEMLIAEPDATIARCYARMELPLVDVDRMGMVIDLSRNNEWAVLLSDAELEELLIFVDEHTEELDEIFPHESCESLYRSMLGRGRSQISGNQGV